MRRISLNLLVFLSMAFMMPAMAQGAGNGTATSCSGSGNGTGSCGETGNGTGRVNDVVRSVSRQVGMVSVTNTVTTIMARTNMVQTSGGFFSPGSGATGKSSGTGSGATGKSSGNGDVGAGGWIMVNGYYLDKSGGTGYHGDTYSLTGGFDKRFEELLLGISVGGEWTDLRLSNSGKYKIQGVTIAPYANYVFQDNLMFDLTVGYSNVTNDLLLRDDNADKVEADFDSWRVFTAGGATGLWELEEWRFSARLGALYLHQSDGGFNPKYTPSGGSVQFMDKVEDSNFDLFQMQIGGRVGYDLGKFMPFVGVTYYQDVNKTGSNDDTAGADFDLGLNWKDGPVTAGITGTYGIREDFQKAGGMLNFRYDF